MNKLRHSRTTSLKATFTAVLALSASAVQAAWDVYPEVTGEYGVDDNVRLSSVNEDSAGVGAAEARLILRNVGETHNVRATIGARHNFYSATDLDGGTAGTAQVAANKRASERISYGVLATYQNQPLLRSAVIDLESGSLLGETPERALGSQNNPNVAQELDIGFIETEVRRQFTQASPYVDFTLSDRSSVRVAGNLYDANYDSDAEILGLEDYKGYGASTQYTYQLSERNSVHVGANFEKSEPDQSDGSKRLDGIVGFSRQVTEQTQVMIEAGVGTVKTDNGTEDTVALFRASADSYWERGQFSFSAMRDTWPTGFGNSVVTDSVEAEWRQSLSPRTELRLRGTFLQADSNLDSGTTFEDRDYADAEVRISYALTRAWRAGGAYRYRWIDRKGDSDTASGNTAFLFISFSPPRPI